MAKPFWKSKTIWINIIIVVLTIILGRLLGLDPVVEVSILGAVNVGLRFATKEPVTLCKKEQKKKR